LDNGLELLLISDYNSNKNAVSLTVGAGSFQDDEELPGLAHMVEHSILAGSYDYPRPSQFEDLLSNHFGSLNSFTEDEKTTFYFESDYLGFEESMKIFSRLFANPKLDINLIPVHILKIEEELKRNLNKDQFKEMQIIKTLSNPSHPFSRFSLGDLAKLKNRNVGYIHSMIKTFYIKFYTPNNMKLSIICKIKIINFS
jgi:insulysin